MKAFIILALAAVSSAAPAADPQLLQSGLPAGPLTPAWGDLVATPRGARPLHLEGFSEDVNQDGFVDPIGQAVAPVVAAAPAVLPYAGYAGYPYALPALAAPVVKKVEVEAPKPVVATYAHALPAATYAHALPALTYATHHVPVATHHYTVPVSTHTETINLGTHVYSHTLPHAYGAPFLGGLPVVAAAAAEPAAEAAVMEE